MDKEMEMKVTLVIKDKQKQIVLTPESEEEKSIFQLFAPANVEKNIKIYQGQYEVDKCVGGWMREFERNDSIILYLEN